MSAKETDEKGKPREALELVRFIRHCPVRRMVGGLFPGFNGLHAKVSLGKIQNPKLPPMHPLVRECVCVR